MGALCHGIVLFLAGGVIASPCPCGDHSFDLRVSSRKVVPKTL